MHHRYEYRKSMRQDIPDNDKVRYKVHGLNISFSSLHRSAEFSPQRCSSEAEGGFG